MSWAREGLPRICRFLFALWGRRVCCLFGKMRIKRCVSSACERQRKALEQKSLTLAPEAQVGLAVTLWPAVARCGLGEMPEGGRRGDPPSQWEPTREPKALTDRFSHVPPCEFLQTLPEVSVTFLH